MLASRKKSGNRILKKLEKAFWLAFQLSHGGKLYDNLY
ncbi:hypothetical protein B4127_1579 [Bacillus pumilus]|uniref:Transposase n=1 Tax=Bacillus pumilus TaxID=1408 RepID=A0AB34QP25_BACPU|nr:hypothetical protein B4127_1579 [Bacillus pumilus]